MSVPRVGAADVQPSPVPVPAHRARALSDDALSVSSTSSASRSLFKVEGKYIYYSTFKITPVHQSAVHLK